MTLAIAAEGVGELAGAGEAAGAASAGAEAGAGRAAGSRSVTERTGVAPTRPKAPAGTRPSSPPAAGRTGQGSTSSSASRSKGGGRLSIPKINIGKSNGSGAHRIVIAEFVACLVLIGVMPILVRPPATDSGGNPHIYIANDLLRLSATCLLFFILALLSNQPKSARFAAAFGGLVTLGAAFNANQAFVALANLLTPKPTPPAGTS